MFYRHSLRRQFDRSVWRFTQEKLSRDLGGGNCMKPQCSIGAEFRLLNVSQDSRLKSVLFRRQADHAGDRVLCCSGKIAGIDSTILIIIEV